MNLNHNAIRKPKGIMAVSRSMGPPTLPVRKKKTASTTTSSSHWGATQHSANRSRTINTSSSSALDTESNHCIAALCEGRGEARCEVGIASINTSQPTLILCQMSDTQSYNNTLTKINILNPTEIVVPVTFLGTTTNRLVAKIKQQFPDIRISSQPRRCFNKALGIETIQQLCLPAVNSICFSVQHKYYALTAAAALISHLQNVYCIYYMRASINMKYEESEGYAIIDVSTADRLELVSTTRPEQATQFNSLFAVLNECKTRIGTRHLRSTILQPPFARDQIESNLNCVGELVRKPVVLTSIKALLQKVSNVDQLLSITSLKRAGVENISPKQLNYILILNGLLDLIEPFRSVMENLEEGFFKRMLVTLTSNEFTEMRGLLRKTINPSAHFMHGNAGITERCFAIKAGVNGVLDLVRKTYTERINDLNQYVKMLATKYNLPLLLSNNNTKGYHITLKLTKQQKWTMKESDLPKCFIQVCRTATAFTMKTHEVLNYSVRLDDILAELTRISNVVVDQTICDLKPYIGLFYKLCEEIAHLDMIHSLAGASVNHNYVQPKFSTFTEVIDSRHPILEQIVPDIMPNSIMISPEYNVHLITGPNASGKSIYIRQVILLQVMAQIGCYVPAASAIFRPMQHIYARVYLEDNMEFGASSFILEMKEMKQMLTLNSPNSLFIIDEVCRSTSAEEGASLAMALTEKFIKSKSFVCMTTHYVTLPLLELMYANVKNWQMETVSDGEMPRDLLLEFRHRLIPGVTRLQHYGAALVNYIWPKCAEDDVYDTLERLTNVPRQAKKFTSIHPAKRLKYNLEADLTKLKAIGKPKRADINRLLNDYQNQLQRFGESAHLNVSVRKDEDSVANQRLEHLEQVPIKMEWDEIEEEEGIADISMAMTVGSASSSYQNIPGFLNQYEDNMDLLEPQVTPIQTSLRSALQRQTSQVLQRQTSQVLQSCSEAPFEAVSGRTSSQASSLRSELHCSPELQKQTSQALQSRYSEANLDTSHRTTSSSGWDVKTANENIISSSQSFDDGSFDDVVMSQIDFLESQRSQLNQTKSSVQQQDNVFNDNFDEELVMSQIDILESQNTNRSESIHTCYTSKSVSEVSKSRKSQSTGFDAVEAMIEDLDEDESTQQEEETTSESQTQSSVVMSVQDSEISKVDTNPKTQKSHTQSSVMMSEHSETSRVDQNPGTPKFDKHPETAKVDKQPETAKVDKQPETAKVDKHPATPNADDDSETSKVDNENNPDVGVLQTETDKMQSRFTLYPEVIVIEGPNEPSPPTPQQPMEIKELPNNDKPSGKSIERKASTHSNSSISYSPLISPDRSADVTILETTTSSSTKFIANDAQNQTSTSSSSIIKALPFRRMNKRFVPPKRLTKKEIREDFDRQDKELYEKSLATNDYTALKHRLLNRPSVKQVHKMRCLVVAQRTEAGVQVIPVNTPKTPKKKTLYPRQLSDKYKGIGMIFSDKNAQVFESFIASDERDIKKFNFIMNSQHDTSPGFNFDPDNMQFAHSASSCSASKLNFGQNGSSSASKMNFGPNESFNASNLNANHNDSIDNIANKYLVSRSSVFEDRSFRTDYLDF